MFKSNGKGFSITFKNGITASVQFGRGNYCENRNKDLTNSDIVSCVDAEIMAWDENNNDILEPQGWQSPEMIMDILNALKDRH